MELIPIGHNCLVAEHLKRLNIRQHSLPFDWVFNGAYVGFIDIIKMIETNFVDFFNYSVEVSRDDINKGNDFTVNTKYDLIYYHQNYMNLEEGAIWREKLADSIDKFRELIKYKKTCFIYSAEYDGDNPGLVSFFKESINYFKIYCEYKNIKAKLVVLHTIKDLTRLTEWEHFLREFDDDEFVTHRRLIIDESDDVWGSSIAFQKSLENIY